MQNLQATNKLQDGVTHFATLLTIYTAFVVASILGLEGTALRSIYIVGLYVIWVWRALPSKPNMLEMEGTASSRSLRSWRAAARSSSSSPSSPAPPFAPCAARPGAEGEEGERRVISVGCGGWGFVSRV